MPSCSIISELNSGRDFIVLRKTFNLKDTIKWAQKSDPDVLCICAYFLMENGIDVISKIKKRTERTKVVIFNSNFTKDQELMLVREGAAGILSCNLATPTIIKALSKVNDGELWITRKMLSLLVGIPPLAPYNLKFHKKRVVSNAR